jgi:hypothetical protein
VLYLKPPFPVFDGIAFFPDHADPTAFYYLPVAPHFSQVPDLSDPTGKRTIPRVQLLKFRTAADTPGSPSNGGFFSFQVDLGIDERKLDDYAGQLQEMLRLRDRVKRPQPALLEGGTVELQLLGIAFDPNGKPILDDGQQPRFAIRKSPAAKPALYGKNEAIFSVELDQWGTELIEASLAASEAMPAGVVYALDFFALRPAFSVHIQADWNRVQTSMQESFGMDCFFASTEIDKVVDKLVEDQVVKIDVDSFLPEGEDAGSWVGRRDQALDQFKDMVLENFFKPSLDPMRPPEPDGWDKAGAFAERLATIGMVGGGAGLMPKFKYTKKDLTRIDQKRADLRMNERITVKRSMYPQALLAGLASVMPKGPDGRVDKSRFVQDVSLGSPWFEQRNVTAHSLVDYANDKVETINVTLKYQGTPKSVLLIEAKKDGDKVPWNSVLDGDRMVRPVEYQYSVYFKGVDTAERPGVVTSPMMTTDGDELQISPRGDNLYFIDDIQFSVAGLPFDDDPAHGIRLAESLLLAKDNPQATWKRFRLDPALDKYDVRVSYLAADNRDIQVDWVTTDQERLIIRDPRPARRTVQVAPAVDWKLVAMIFVEMRYLDEENGVDEQRTLAFFDTPEDRSPKTFSVNLEDPGKRLVSYQPTFVLKDNRTIVVPRSITAGSTVVLRTDMAGHRVISVEPPDVDFAKRGIVRIEAELGYQDPDAGLSFGDRYTFASARDTGLFEFDYASAAHSSYSCRATLVLANGLVLERDLGSQGGDRVLLPSG